MKPLPHIVFGIILPLVISAFTSLATETALQRKQSYTANLQTGDSLVITNAFTNCFNDSKFTLKLYMLAKEIELSFHEEGQPKIIHKTLPLDFKKDLYNFEMMTDPNMAYGIGSGCQMIFKLNNQPADTLRKCPKEKHYQRLLERIKEDS